MEAMTIRKKIYYVEDTILKTIRNVRGLKNSRYDVMCANIHDIYQDKTTIGRFVLTGTPLFLLSNGELRLKIGNLAWLSNVVNNVNVQECDCVPQQAKGIHINLLDSNKTIKERIDEAVEINTNVIKELRKEFYGCRWLAKLCHCCWITYCDCKTLEETKVDKQLTMMFTKESMIQDSRVAELCRLFAQKCVTAPNKKNFHMVTLPIGTLKNVLHLIDAN